MFLLTISVLMKWSIELEAQILKWAFLSKIQLEMFLLCLTWILHRSTFYITLHYTYFLCRGLWLINEQIHALQLPPLHVRLEFYVWAFWKDFLSEILHVVKTKVCVSCLYWLKLEIVGVKPVPKQNQNNIKRLHLDMKKYSWPSSSTHLSKTGSLLICLTVFQ